MKKWQFAFLTSTLVIAPLVASAPAFAATTPSTAVASGLTLSTGQTSITLNVPNLDNQLQASPTLQFTFTPSDGTTPVTTTGTLSNATTDQYTVPIPNFGQIETVNISTQYTFSGVNYTATAGPLIDTLPEAPLAAALPLGMLGIWYLMRKKRVLPNS